jgi:hypothetical protein
MLMKQKYIQKTEINWMFRKYLRGEDANETYLFRKLKQTA